MVEPFYGSSGPRDARIMIVGEAWGAVEAATGRPFANPKGAGGLLDEMLAEVGLRRSDCFVTNVVCARPPGNDMKEFFITTKSAKSGDFEEFRGLYPKPIVHEHLERLYAEIAAVNPDLIIGFGNYSLWALTKDSFKIGNLEGYKVPTGIGNWRGSQLRTNSAAGYRLFLPTYHPAAIMRMWPWRAPAVRDLRRALTYGEANRASPAYWNEPDNWFVTEPTFSVATNRLDQLYDMLETGPIPFAVDLETRWKSHIACVGIAQSRYSAICIPFLCGEDSHAYWPEDEEFEIIKALRRVLRHPNARIIGQNFGYDLQYIAKDWFCTGVQVHHDTMLAQNLIYPGTPKALYYIASLYAEFYQYWKDEGKDWDPKVGDEQQWVYNCKDAAYTFECYETQQALIEKYGLEEQWEEQLFGFHLAFEMMQRGVPVSRKTRGKLAMDLLEAITERERWLLSIIPSCPGTKSKKPWYRSPKQQMQIFYDMLGLTVVKHPKTKRPTVDDEALELMKARCPVLRPVFEKLQEIRSLNKFSETVHAALEPDGRMRCMYNPGGTESFRWSSGTNAFDRGTNLQNISEGREDG